MEIIRMTAFPYASLRALYESVGWANYLKDIEKFEQMFPASLAVYGAYEDDRLVAVVRLVGDDAHILYVQDILVHPDHQALGIGKALMERVLIDYEHVRQKVLITDMDDSHVQDFYLSLGFVRSIDKNIICYVKL